MLNFKGKKAMSINFLVGVIIVLVSFAVIAPIASKYVGEDEKKIESLCKSTVAIRASAAINVKNVAELRTSPVLCKTIDKKIKGTKKEVMKQIADKMAKCWEMFGEGKYAQNIFDTLTIFGGDKKCFMCYTIMVDEIEDDETITAKEFETFLMENDHPKLKGITYLDYIQSFGGDGQVMLFSDGIVVKHAYAIGYKAKESECKTCKYLAIEGIKGASIGLTVGTESKTNEDIFYSEVNIDSIYVIDMGYDQLKKLFEETCEKIEEDIGGK